MGAENGAGPKRIVFYDLDGTLVDTRRDIANAVNHMRATLGLAPLPEGEICGYVGLGLRQLVESCLPDGADAARVEHAMKVYRAFYTEHLLDHTRLYAGVREVLEHFRARGLAQAVITNKPNPFSRQILEALGVAGFFLEIVGGDSLWPKKPDPQALVALLEREQVRPAQALFVGDSPIDVETGARAGVLTVVVAQGFSSRAELERAQPDRTVKDFRELLALARKEGW